MSPIASHSLEVYSLHMIFHAEDRRFKDSGSPSPYGWITSRIISDSRLELAVRRLPPKGFSHPYHWHEKSEEVFVILKGEGLIRTPDELVEVKSSDIAVFPPGEIGAHQIHNTSENDYLEYLDLGTARCGDICHYPDSNKTNDLDTRTILKDGEPVSYFDSEEDPSRFWKGLSARLGKTEEDDVLDQRTGFFIVGNKS